MVFAKFVGDDHLFEVILCCCCLCSGTIEIRRRSRSADASHSSRKWSITIRFSRGTHLDLRHCHSPLDCLSTLNYEYLNNCADRMCCFERGRRESGILAVDYVEPLKVQLQADTDLLQPSPQKRCMVDMTTYQCSTILYNLLEATVVLKATIQVRKSFLQSLMSVYILYNRTE